MTKRLTSLLAPDGQWLRIMWGNDPMYRTVRCEETVIGRLFLKEKGVVYATPQGEPIGTASHQAEAARKLRKWHLDNT